MTTPATPSSTTVAPAAPSPPAAPAATPVIPAVQTSAQAAAPAPSALAAAAAAEPPKPAEAPKPVELKLPAGVDAKAFDGYRKLAGELGLDSEKAQKVLDNFVAVDAERAKAAEVRWRAQDEKWAAEIQADAEVGGEKHQAALVHVRRALDKFGGKAFATTLHQAGLGNHPALFKCLVAIGKALAEDSVAGSAAAAGGERPALQDVLYPTMNKQKEP